MPWVMVVVGYDKYDQPIKKKVWRADPPKPKPNAKKKAGQNKKAAQAQAAKRAAAAARRAAAEAARRREEAARRNAERARQAATARLAAEQKRRAQDRANKQRALAYQALAERTQRNLAVARAAEAARAGVKRPAPLVRPTAPVDERDTARFNLRTDQAKRQMAAAASIAQARREQAQREYWAEYSYRWQKQKTFTNKNALTSDYERLLAQESQRAKNGQIDTRTVDELTKLYVQRAEKTAADYKTLVGRINELIDKGNYEAAEKLYKGDFRLISKEFQRLFGDGTNPEKDGTFNKFFADRNAVDAANTAYWKKQMKSALQSEKDSLESQLIDARRHGQSERSKELSELLEIYNGKTGWVADGVDENGSTHYRRRTLQEELQHRQAQKQMEAEKLRAAYEMTLREDARLAVLEGRTARDQFGNWVTPATAQAEQDILNTVKTQFGGRAPEIKRPEDQYSFADKVMDAWLLKNPRPVVTMTNRYASSPALAEWERRKQAYETSIYDYLGGVKPEFWDRTLALPGVSHAMAALQGGVSAIGAAGRIILKGTTGQSQLDTGIEWSELPEHVKQRLGLGGPLAGIADIAAMNPMGGGTANLGKIVALQDWLRSEEGKAWLLQRMATNVEQASEQDKAFLEGFYGDGDLGDKLDVLNAFGSSPTTSPTRDLMFQLLADPTNAIPLKFTTYLARAKYAQEVSQGSNVLSQNLRKIRDFVKVDEAELKLRSYLKSELKVVKDDPTRVSTLMDNLRNNIADVKDPAERRTAIAKAFRDAGIDPRLVNDTQVQTLIEQSLKTELENRGISLFTREQELEEKIAAARAADVKAKAEATAKADREKAATRLAEEQRIAAQQQAVERLTKQRDAAVAEAMALKNADAAAPAVRAAEGVAGPPPPAVKKGKYDSPEAAKAARNKRRREARAAKAAEDARRLDAAVKKATRNLERTITKPRVVKGKVAIPDRGTPRQRKLAKEMRVQDPMAQPLRPKGAKPSVAVADETRRILYAEEYYKFDEVAGWLPKSTQVAKDPAWKALRDRAAAGDVQARAELSNWARKERNAFRMIREDLTRDARFTPTAYDVAERAGVESDEVATARLLEDRQMVAKLKARTAQDRKAFASEHVYAEGRIVRDGDRAEDLIDDAAPSATVRIGDELVAAKEGSPFGMHDIYTVFSGIAERAQHYSGGYFSRVRDANWRNKLTKYRFAQMLRNMDDGYTSFKGTKRVEFDGPAGFRDAGQALFELFHRLRLDGNLDQLKKMSDAVDAYLDELGDTADESVFGWQWKVMEERANLPWALEPALVEAQFVAAAANVGLHPQLALGMIPNGFYAVRPPNRFKLSGAISGLGSNPLFRTHPVDWVEGDALKAVTSVFSKKSDLTSQITHYTAGRFGNFWKGRAIFNRIHDELAAAVIKEIGTEELTKILLSDPEAFLDMRKAHALGGNPPAEILKRALDTAMLPRRSRGGFALRPDFRNAGQSFRDALVDAYDRGLVTLDNPEAHKLMLLMRMQDHPDARLRHLDSFSRHMEAIGQVDAARTFVTNLFEKEYKSLLARSVFERLNMVTGKLNPAETLEWQIYERLGMGITPARLKRIQAWNKRVNRAAEDSWDVQQQRIRDAIDAEIRVVPGDAYTGTTGLDEVVERFETKLDAYRKSDDVSLKRTVAKTIVDDLERIFVRSVDKSGANITAFDWEEIEHVIEILRKDPAAQKLLDALAERLHDTAMAETRKLALEPMAYQEALLRLRLKAMEVGGKSKRIKPEYAERFRQTQLELEALLTRKFTGMSKAEKDAFAAKKAAYLAEAEAARTPGAVQLDPRPEPTAAAAPRDAAVNAVTALTRLTEDQWWDELSRRARAVLADKTATATQKAKARLTLSDVISARQLRVIERQRGTLSLPVERRRFADGVVKKYGKEAEDMIADKAVAPYVEDGVGLAVEQGRTYYRSWQRALRGPRGDSPVRGITLADGTVSDFMPKDVFDRLEPLIADAVSKVRGRQADSRTRARGPNVQLEETNRVSRITDSDKAIVDAKNRVLHEFAQQTGIRVSVEAYDEARTVLWTGYVQNKTASWLLAKATEAAKSGGKVGDIYKKMRKTVAKRESRLQLHRLASVEMYGASAESVLTEFMARYGDDGILRGDAPLRSDYQIRTLEEHFKAVSGVTDTADTAQAAVFLGQRNLPSMTNRTFQREFLTQIGAWSPRRAEQFTQGARSWSIDQELEFMMDSYAQAPVWAYRSTYADIPDFFDDQGVRMETLREWGIFNASVESKVRLSDKSAEELQALWLKGDETLGVKPRRSLEEQRRYYADRYGDLVVGEDGKFKAIPELMYPDELRTYFQKKSTDRLAEDLIQGEDELREFEQQMRPLIDQFFDDFIAPVDGVVHYEDLFKFSADLQARMLKNPKWASRWRDWIGKTIGGFGAIQRAMVFTQMSFAVMNAVDSPLKNMWYRYTRAGIMGGRFLEDLPAGVAGKVDALTPENLGIKYRTTLMNYQGRSAWDTITNPIEDGLAGAIERAGGVGKGIVRAFPAVAAKAEIASKMNLARDMYPRVYRDALKAADGNEELADLLAKKFIKEEVNKLWPTRGDGPFERLFNEFVPFASYMFKNHVLFISEAMAHPSVLNWFEYIGAYIEQGNLRNWEATHPDGEPMPEQMRRRIELPWAPGYYLDLGQFTDATRGLKPLYKAADGPQTFKDIASQWIRIVNPNTQAAIYQLTNALGITQRIQWKPIYDEQGYLQGYEKVITGWTEPWSKEQPTLASWLWPVDVFESFQEFGKGGWTAGEASQFFGKVAFFEAIQPADRGAGLYQLYITMREQNQGAADAWLRSSPEGAILREWLASRADRTFDVMNILMLNERFLQDPNRFLHTQTPEFQKAIREGYQTINEIRAYWEERLMHLTPGTQEYRDAKASMLLHISDVYRVTPELLRYEVWKKTPSEWSKQLADWETDKLTDDFFALANKRPLRAQFDSVVEYNEAVAAWNRNKQLFLKQYPQVADRVAGARSEYQRVRDLVNAEWDRVLNSVAKRNEAIEAARKMDDKERVDMLSFANSLEFSILEQDYVAMYFTEDDFNQLPFDVAGPPSLKDRALKTVTTLLDFDAVRAEKAKREGRYEEFLRDTKYHNGLREIALIAKGGDPFGTFDPKKWIDALKSRPSLLGEYYRRNPGKQQQFERNDAYIRLIGRWGKAIGAGVSFDKSLDIWKSLPLWVRQRYLDTHPDSKMTLSGEFSSANFKTGSAQGAAYFGWIQKWTSHFDRDDVKGGMDFFWKMPSWVRERYFAKNPDKRAKWEADLKYGQDLAAYFSFQDAGEQADWLNDHPGLKKWLQQHVNSPEQRRQAILAAYRKIPSDDAWLRKVFRERYPEVFSVEAMGERKLKAVYDELARHPEAMPGFEKWLEAIWASYADMVKLGQARPRPLDPVDRSLRSRHRRRSLSAAEASR